MRKLTGAWWPWRSASPSGEQRAQRAQRGGLVLVAPQRLELRRVVLERHAEHVGGQREQRLGEREAAAARERDVGHERRRAGRAVDRAPSAPWGAGRARR